MAGLWGFSFSIRWGIGEGKLEWETVMLDIVMEDEAVIVVRKPAGVESQGGRGFSMDLESEIRNYLYRKSGGKTSYVGVIHRLDRPVCGVMVYAKTKQAAADLSRQVQNGTMKKRYYAILCGRMHPKKGTLEDYLVKDGRTNLSRVADKTENGAKKAVLNYETVDFSVFHGLDGLLSAACGEERERSMVEIELITGRHHQIRVQFSHAGCPILWDTRYNPDFSEKKGGSMIGLCAHSLSFVHPVMGRRQTFTWE